MNSYGYANGLKRWVFAIIKANAIGLWGGESRGKKVSRKAAKSTKAFWLLPDWEYNGGHCYVMCIWGRWHLCVRLKS